MGRKAKVLYEQKTRAVNEYLSGKGSFNQIAKNYGIHSFSLKLCVRKYKILIIKLLFYHF